MAQDAMDTWVPRGLAFPQTWMYLMGSRVTLVFLGPSPRYGIPRWDHGISGHVSGICQAQAQLLSTCV